MSEFLPPDYQKELAVLRDAVTRAAAAIRGHYRSPDLQVSFKDPQQPVTIADFQANEILKKAIAENFPDDAWLSEEDPDDRKRLSAKRVWIVDPLDGTRDFIDHNPEFAISIALVENQEPVIGVICNPITEEFFWAVRGVGSFLGDGERLSVLAPNTGTKLSLFVSRTEYKRGEWRNYSDAFDVIPKGGSAYKMALVAAGKVNGSFTLQPKSEWDVCAGHLLVTEAGGTVSDAQGGPVSYNRDKPKLKNIVYAEPGCHQLIVKTLREKGLS